MAGDGHGRYDSDTALCVIPPGYHLPTCDPPVIPGSHLAQRRPRSPRFTSNRGPLFFSKKNSFPRVSQWHHNRVAFSELARLEIYHSTYRLHPQLAPTPFLQHSHWHQPHLRRFRSSSRPISQYQPPVVSVAHLRLRVPQLVITHQTTSPMVFPQLSSYLGGASSQESVNASQSMGLDSITLGQLKAMVGSAPKPKAGLTSSGSPSPSSHRCRESSNLTMTFVTMTRTPSSTRSRNSILMLKCHKSQRT